MDVASYIREYLFKQDFLDIPGLGTFFLTKEPFRIEEENLIIKPGAKTLIFRENASINNDTLTYFLARRAEVSVEEARLGVHEFIGPIRQLFLSRGTIEIEGLGEFSVPDGFHLEFKPFPGNFSPSSFGLGIVNLGISERTAQEHGENDPGISYPLEAEDIYKAYGFESTEEPDPVSQQHVSSSEAVLQVEEPASGPGEAPETEAPENQESTLAEAAPVKEPSAQSKDLVFNPLAFTSDPVQVSNPGSESQAADQEQPVQERAEENPYAQSYQPEARKENTAVYWIIGGCLLLGLIAGIAYMERGPIVKSLTSAGLLHPSGVPRSSSLRSDSTVSRSASSLQAPDSLKEVSADSAAPKDSRAAQKPAALPADSTGMTPVNRAGRFMVIAGSVHLLQTARKWQKEMLQNGVSARIIEMPKGQLMRYKLSLGNYPDKASATGALTALEAKGEKRAQVFENKSSKN